MQADDRLESIWLDAWRQGSKLLDASGLGLTSVPDWVASLDEVRELDLSDTPSNRCH